MNQEPNPKDFEQLQAGKDAEILLRHVESYCAGRYLSISRSIFEILKAKKALDPQVAIQAWQNLYASEAFRVDLEKKIRRGQQASERLTPFMGENPPT